MSRIFFFFSIETWIQFSRAFGFAKQSYFSLIPSLIPAAMKTAMIWGIGFRHLHLSWEPTNYSYFRWSRAYYIGPRAPHTNTFFRSKMCPFSRAFSHTFHTKTPLRKLFLKVESSQNALFWKRSVSTVDSWNGKLSQTATKTEKGHIRSFQFNQRFRTFQCEREAKTHQKVYVFPNENALVWSNNNMKTAVWAKIFCFVLVETETEFFKTH